MRTYPPGSSLLFALAVGLTLGLLTLDLSQGLSRLMPHLAWISFVGGMGFLMLRTGRISRWRSLFFVVLAWAFVLDFKAGSLGLRGSAFATSEIQEVPYCHIAIASSILNYAYSEFLAIKSGNWAAWGPLSLGFLWLLVTLVLGQAWCSWACFYGGLDDGFARILRRPALRWVRLPGPMRELPAGILLFSILISLTSLLPVFCLWACPLKITTGFLDPNDAARKVQLSIFLLLAALALVLGPILTRKRVFCGLICPFGAWQSFWGRANPFRVTIRPELCTQCQICLKACPIFAIEPQGLKGHAISPYCNRCGECLDVCPTEAIRYTLLGSAWDSRLLFLYCGLTVGGAVGGLFVPGLLSRWLQALGISG